MELNRPYSSKGKCNREGGYGVEPTRTKEKGKAKEELAESNTRETWAAGKNGEKLNISARIV
jgi:hypothetical protein